jgi:hypothetical protein
LILINNIKITSNDPSQQDIQELQIKLNIFNEIDNSFQQLSVDGSLGSNTKTAIFDFEESNPYFPSKKF